MNSYIRYLISKGRAVHAVQPAAQAASPVEPRHDVEQRDNVVPFRRYALPDVQRAPRREAREGLVKRPDGSNLITYEFGRRVLFLVKGRLNSFERMLPSIYPEVHRKYHGYDVDVEPRRGQR